MDQLIKNEKWDQKMIKYLLSKVKRLESGLVSLTNVVNNITINIGDGDDDMWKKLANQLKLLQLETSLISGVQSVLMNDIGYYHEIVTRMGLIGTTTVYTSVSESVTVSINNAISELNYVKDESMNLDFVTLVFIPINCDLKEEQNLIKISTDVSLYVVKELIYGQDLIGNQLLKGISFGFGTMIDGVSHQVLSFQTMINPYFDDDTDLKFQIPINGILCVNGKATTRCYFIDNNVMRSKLDDYYDEQPKNLPFQYVDVTGEDFLSEFTTSIDVYSDACNGITCFYEFLPLVTTFDKFLEDTIIEKTSVVKRGLMYQLSYNYAIVDLIASLDQDDLELIEKKFADDDKRDFAKSMLSLQQQVNTLSLTAVQTINGSVIFSTDYQYLRSQINYSDYLAPDQTPTESDYTVIMRPDSDRASRQYKSLVIYEDPPTISGKTVYVAGDLTNDTDGNSFEVEAEVQINLSGLVKTIGILSDFKWYNDAGEDVTGRVVNGAQMEEIHKLNGAGEATDTAVIHTINIAGVGGVTDVSRPLLFVQSRDSSPGNLSMVFTFTIPDGVPVAAGIVDGPLMDVKFGNQSHLLPITWNIVEHVGEDGARSLEVIGALDIIESLNIVRFGYVTVLAPKHNDYIFDWEYGATNQDFNLDDVQQKHIEQDGNIFSPAIMRLDGKPGDHSPGEDVVYGLHLRDYAIDYELDDTVENPYEINEFDLLGKVSSVLDTRLLMLSNVVDQKSNGTPLPQFWYGGFPLLFKITDEPLKINYTRVPPGTANLYILDDQISTLAANQIYLGQEIKGILERLDSLEQRVAYLEEVQKRAAIDMMMGTAISFMTLGGGSAFTQIAGVIIAFVALEINVVEMIENGFSMQGLVNIIEYIIQIFMHIKSVNPGAMPPGDTRQDKFTQIRDESIDDYQSTIKSSKVSINSSMRGGSRIIDMEEDLGYKFASVAYVELKQDRSLSSNSAYMKNLADVIASGNATTQQKITYRLLQNASVRPMSEKIYVKWAETVDDETYLNISHVNVGEPNIYNSNKNLTSRVIVKGKAVTTIPKSIYFRFKLNKTTNEYELLPYTEAGVSKADVMDSYYLDRNKINDYTDDQINQLYKASADTAIGVPSKGGTYQIGDNTYVVRNVPQKMPYNIRSQIDEMVKNIAQGQGYPITRFGSNTVTDDVINLVSRGQRPNGWYSEVDYRKSLDHLNSLL